MGGMRPKEESKRQTYAERNCPQDYNTDLLQEMNSFQDQGNEGNNHDFIQRTESSPVPQHSNNSNDSFKTTEGVYGGRYTRNSFAIPNQYQVSGSGQEE